MKQDVATPWLIGIAVFIALLLAAAASTFAFPFVLMRMNDDLPEPV
jgi:hypothetical protein